MDEQERRIEGEDVEAHRRKAQLLASEEATDETEGEDVEAHRRKAQMLASEDATGEEEGEDDVEAHALRHRPQSM
jgi:hypothetical protein